MARSTIYPTLLAYQVLRVALGVSILMHGLVRIAGLPGFVSGMVTMFKDTPMPEAMVMATAYVTVPLETLVGLGLILGICLVPVLLVGSLWMIVLISGMALLQKWELVNLQLNYVLLYAILIAFSAHNRPLWRVLK